MNNIYVIPSKKEDIDKILSKDIKGIILGVKDLSIYNLELDLDTIINIAKNTSKEVIVVINKMIHNKDLDYVKEVLIKINNSNIKGVIFYNVGIIKIAKDINFNKELIINKEHQNTNYLTNNFFYNKEVHSSFLSSDITYKEILDIKDNSKMNIYYTVYGYLPIFYSRRHLLSSYFDYIKKDKDDIIYYIYNKEDKYMVREEDYGTIIYSPLVNLINEIEKLEGINYVIDLSFNDNIDIIDRFINKDKEDDTYTGFFDKETIYKLKGDK